MVKKKSRIRRAGRKTSKFLGQERNILGQGTSVKSLVKGGVAVTLGNQVVGGIIDRYTTNPTIKEMRFPLSMIAVGSVLDGQKDLRSAGIKVASAIALNKYVFPKLGVALGGQRAQANGNGNGNGTAVASGIAGIYSQ
jgi:hypothetical protein